MQNFLIKFFHTSAIILLFNICISSQVDYKEGSTSWLVDMFFNKAAFTEKADYYTGEMLEDLDQLTIGEELKGMKQNLFRKLGEDTGKSVYAVEVNIDSRIIDFYCFMAMTETGWKIEAIRRFLLPAFLYSAADSLSEIENLSKKDLSIYNMLFLFTTNDANLKLYLENKINEFYELIWFFKEENSEGTKSMLEKLNLTALFRDDKYPGCIFLQVETFEKRESGYIFAEESSALPKISPDNFIYIEEVLPGWYVYRII